MAWILYLMIEQDGDPAGSFDWPDILGRLGPDALFAVIVIYLMWRMNQSNNERFDRVMDRVDKNTDKITDALTESAEAVGNMRGFLEGRMRGGQ